MPDRAEGIDQSPVRPSIRSQGRVPSSSRLDTRLERLNTNDEYYGNTDSPSTTTRPALNSRASTFQGPTAIYRESPISATSRQYSDIGTLRGQLRQTSTSRQPSTQRINTRETREAPDVFGDPSDESTLNSASPDRSYGARSVSPATSHGSAGTGVLGNASNGAGGRKAPPPPPSRVGKNVGGKKAPPPPPMKRAEISSTSVNRY
jgi:hypothetical protein